MMIKALTPADWQTMKDFRLKALKESPEAFARTYEEELAFDDNVWIKRTDGASEGKERICFLCFDGEKPVGIGGSSVSKQRKQASSVNSVWVDPAYRGTEAAKMIMDCLKDWASSIGLTQMEGLVTSTNERALGFYKKYGFEVTNETETLERDPSVVSVLIRMKIDANQSCHTTKASAPR